jgi:colicin import membrane protein
MSMKPPGPPGRPEPFRYGWRYVRILRPDGTEDLDQVPLTLDDVLHPEVGDVIPESDPHNGDRGYIKAVSKRRLVDDRTAVVLSDCQVDFNIRGVKPLCPDLAVFFGVRRRIAWSSFNVAEEGARPVLVVEVTSPETRSHDIRVKVDYYRRANVPSYVIADVTVEEEDERRIEFIAYHRKGRRYHRVAPNE